MEYEKNDETNPVGEEDDFDELEEEDEEPVSAVHLMGHLYEAGKLLSRDTIMNQSLGFYGTKLIWRITTNQNSKPKLDCTWYPEVSPQRMLKSWLQLTLSPSQFADSESKKQKDMNY